MSQVDSILTRLLALHPKRIDLSLDRVIATRRGRVPRACSPWAQLSLGLLHTHASAITLAALTPAVTIATASATRALR